MDISLGPWRSMAICHLNMQFLSKKLISFSAGTSKINKRFHGEYAKRGQNVPLTYNSANILAHLIDFLKKRREENSQKIRKLEPPCLFKK